MDPHQFGRYVASVINTFLANLLPPGTDVAVVIRLPADSPERVAHDERRGLLVVSNEDVDDLRPLVAALAYRQEQVESGLARRDEHGDLTVGSDQERSAEALGDALAAARRAAEATRDDDPAGGPATVKRD